MRTLFLLGAAVGLAHAGSPSAHARSARAQSSPCLANADTAAAYRTKIVALVGSADPTLYTHGEPHADSSLVTAVSDTLVCRAAVSTYNAGFPVGTDSVLFADALYVFAIGTAGYGVIRPGARYGEYEILYLYDPQWNLAVSVGI